MNMTTDSKYSDYKTRVMNAPEDGTEMKPGKTDGQVFKELFPNSKATPIKDDPNRSIRAALNVPGTGNKQLIIYTVDRQAVQDDPDNPNRLDEILKGTQPKAFLVDHEKGTSTPVQVENDGVSRFRSGGGAERIRLKEKVGDLPAETIVRTRFPHTNEYDAVHGSMKGANKASISAETPNKRPEQKPDELPSATLFIENYRSYDEVRKEREK